MPRTRVFGLAIVLTSALAAAYLAAGCTNARGQAGDACLKDYDCESDRCVQYICLPTPMTTKVDGAVDTATTDAAEDSAVADSGADTAVADTAVADSAVADSGAADTAIADTGAADTATDAATD